MSSESFPTPGVPYDPLWAYVLLYPMFPMQRSRAGMQLRTGPPLKFPRPWRVHSPVFGGRARVVQLAVRTLTFFSSITETNSLYCGSRQLTNDFYSASTEPASGYLRGLLKAARKRAAEAEAALNWGYNFLWKSVGSLWPMVGCRNDRDMIESPVHSTKSELE